MNDTIGRAYEVKGTGTPWEKLAARAAKSTYARGIVPRGACILTIGIDCQLDRVEWVLLGHGREFRRYVVDHGVIDGHISERDTQNHIDGLMGRRWPNYCGIPMGVTLTALDSNYMTDDCLAYARQHPTTKLIAVRGSPGDLAPRLRYVARERDEQKGTLLKTIRKNFLHVGVNSFKMSLYLDLAKDDPALRGYFAFPTGLDDDFFQQLVSETRVAVKRMGTIVYQWQKPDRQRNEILDTVIYASAAAIRAGVYKKSAQSWSQLEQDLHRDISQPVPSRPISRPGVSLVSKIAGYGQGQR